MSRGTYEGANGRERLEPRASSTENTQEVWGIQNMTLEGLQ